jgi:Flp pilus assembly protein TadB
MLQAISIWKFTQLFSLYALASLATYFAVAFTIPAALAYSFIIAPFYLACILYLINFTLKQRQKKIRYQSLPLWLSIISQFLIIFTSPASCYGWKQGEACYSFIQTHLTKKLLKG